MANRRSFPNLLINPETGAPRWNAASEQLGPKEDFAFEAASRLLDGSLTLDDLKDQIIKAANYEMVRRGEIGKLLTLNDVKQHVGKSGKDWYFELQRVSQHNELLQILMNQEGRGLTALARKAGPIQAQRRKGYADRSVIAEIRDLIDVLEELKSGVRDGVIRSQSISSMCSEDAAKYRALLA